MVMEPVSIEAAIEKAKKKGLRPGRVKGTDGIQFTKGRNERIEVISWDEFRQTLTDRKLEVYDSGGFMKIMKRRK
jgi:sugar phosphate isomerase/epimerase